MDDGLIRREESIRESLIGVRKCVSLNVNCVEENSRREGRRHVLLPAASRMRSPCTIAHMHVARFQGAIKSPEGQAANILRSTRRSPASFAECVRSISQCIYDRETR